MLQGNNTGVKLLVREEIPEGPEASQGPKVGPVRCGTPFLTV